MRLMIIVPDGVGIKNYLYSDLIQKLAAQNISIHIVSKLDKDFIEQLYDPPRYTAYPLVAYKETFPEVFLREIVKHAKLIFFAKKLKNKTILSARSLGNTLSKKLFFFFVHLLATVTAFLGHRAIEKINEIYFFTLSRRNLEKFKIIFDEIKPDIIFSTHQRPLENIPYYEQARRLGIPRTSVIYSWDNIGKFSLNTPSEHYFLWSDFMLEQMQLFYPEISPKKLIITGTPQFSFYFDKAFMWERNEFLSAFNIPLDKKFIIFSGSDIKTSPDDPVLLQDLIDAVEQLPRADQPIVIFRRSPADFSGRFDKILNKYSNVISIDPLWINNGNSWASAIPTKEDIKYIVGLIQHCSLILNVGSTMAIDGATHNKPCIYLTYTPEGSSYLDYEKAIQGKDHFKVIRNIDAVTYVKQKEALPFIIQSILNNPEKFCTQKDEMLKRISNNILIDSSDRISMELQKAAKNYKNQ